jgi:hypothetical protein
VSLCAGVSVHTHIRIGVCLSMRAHAYLCGCMSVALYMGCVGEGIVKRQEEGGGEEGHVSNKLSLSILCQP